MTLTGAISSALSGLQVTSLRADTVANNIANASTPGYVRRSVIASELLVGNETAGVRSEGVARSQNEALTNQRRSVSSNLGQATVLANTFQTLSTRLGDSLDGTGLFGTFDDFETALSDAAITPESDAQLRAVFSTAQALAGELNSLSQLVVNQRSAVDREVNDAVQIVNSSLQTIEELNGRLASSKPNSEEAAALTDERQRALDTIAEYIPIQSLPRDRGTIDVITQEGVFLLAGEARQIEFQPAAAFTPESSLAGGQLSGLTVDDIDVTPGANSFGAISGGVLGALFQLRDDDLPQFDRQLDAIAEDLIARVSDDAIDPTKVPGEQGIFVDPTAAGGVGLANRITLNTAVDPAQGGDFFRLRDGVGAITEGPPGNSTILNGLLGAITEVRPINSAGIRGSFSGVELAGELSAIIGQKRVSSESVLAASTAQFEILVDAETQENGVNIDEQLQQLLIVEQAFAANARVIEVTGQLLNQLLEI
ncbi:MAG: flagellar hook-associated protein FlgK [Pseudomonadota bacterium]